MTVLETSRSDIEAGEHWADNAPLADAFRQFDGANPQVYAELVKLARAWRARRGEQKAGVGMLWEVLRWNLTMSMETQTEEPFKLNNNHRSFYARKVMAHYPELAGIFEIRARDGRCECQSCHTSRR